VSDSFFALEVLKIITAMVGIPSFGLFLWYKNTSTMASPKDFDIRAHLKTRFPGFFLLLGGNSLDWKSVNSAFAKRGARYKERLERTGETFRIEASLYNIIISSIQGDIEAQRMFGFIKNLFSELVHSTTPSEKKEIKAALYGMLTNVDKDYKNFVGELSVLNMLKRQKNIILLKSEKPLISEEPKGIKIDFHLLHEDTQKEWLVEVVNIHLDDTNTASHDAVDFLLNDKIGGKLIATGIKKSKAFILVPVLWGYWDEIKIVTDYYQNKNPQFENTITPVCFIPFTDPVGEPRYKFGTIDTIFENAIID
jgi:hypothetical protein